MYKFKKVLISILSLLSEYITLFSTIIASTYIVIKSQYTDFSTPVLLLWIISLLGLIAISIAAEKFFKLKKIENDVSFLREINQQSFSSLDQIFFKRKTLKPLEERLKSAKTIFISGGSLARLSDEYYGFFEDKIKDGCHMKVILTAPKSEAAKQVCLNTVYETKSIDLYNQKIKDSIDRFKDLDKKFPDSIEVYLTEKTPPFSIVATDMNKENSFIQVELYSYAVPTRERIEFLVTPKDSETYQFFTTQIDILLESAKII